MMVRTLRNLAFLAALNAWCIVYGQVASPQLLDLSGGVEKTVKASSEQVSVKAGVDASKPGVVVEIAAGDEGYPGVTITPSDGETWDLSKFGHIEAVVTNTGDKTIGLTMRVDDDGSWKDNPWNATNASIKPGKTGKVEVIFGYSWGKPAHKLNSSAIKRILLFTGKAKSAESFRIESVLAGGEAGEKPPVKPESIRTKPKDGILLGAGVSIDATKQLSESRATAASADGRIVISFAKEANNKIQSATFKPPVGRWDLRDYLQVRVALKNTGKVELTPRACISSNGGKSDWIEAKSPLAPGAETTLVIPFISSSPWNGAEPRTSGDQLSSDAVSGVIVATHGGEDARELTIESIRADVPAAAELPDWLGKRPPVEGQWTKTFDDEFDGSEVDLTKWQITGENYWDKKSHFSKANVIVGDGVVRLRFEKKAGHQNDDPNHKRVTDYATGYLATYGKWTQRYGYFEARMKLPTAPGLWPAFWMMPDRGGDDPQWVRQSTEKGGMEFDIMEYLTRWGPHRYNIAMHWDGYGKNHKSIGSEKIYFQPDKDGYVTAGLLWTPGLLVYYCNGREVGRWENERVSNVPADIMFTLPMGGWDNSPLDDSKLPDDFVIDYVRAWQRSDLATPAPAK